MRKLLYSILFVGALIACEKDEIEFLDKEVARVEEESIQRDQDNANALAIAQAQLQAAIQAEAAARQAGDEELASNLNAAVTTLSSAIQAEAVARAAGDAQLAADLKSNVDMLVALLAKEEEARAAGDLANANALADAVADLSSAISAEQRARISGDASNAAALDRAVNTINETIAIEQQAREDGDADLLQKIKNLRKKLRRAVEALEEADRTNKAELQAAIDVVSAGLADTNIELEQLENYTEVLTDLIELNTTAIEANEAAIGDIMTALEDAVATINTIFDTNYQTLAEALAVIGSEASEQNDIQVQLLLILNRVAALENEEVDLSSIQEQIDAILETLEANDIDPPADINDVFTFTPGVDDGDGWVDVATKGAYSLTDHFDGLSVTGEGITITNQPSGVYSLGGSFTNGDATLTGTLTISHALHTGEVIVVLTNDEYKPDINDVFVIQGPGSAAHYVQLGSQNGYNFSTGPEGYWSNKENKVSLAIEGGGSFLGFDTRGASEIGFTFDNDGVEEITVTMTHVDLRGEFVFTVTNADYKPLITDKYQVQNGSAAHRRNIQPLYGSIQGARNGTFTVSPGASATWDGGGVYEVNIFFDTPLVESAVVSMTHPDYRGELVFTVTNPNYDADWKPELSTVFNFDQSGIYESWDGSYVLDFFVSSTFRSDLVFTVSPDNSAGEAHSGYSDQLSLGRLILDVGTEAEEITITVTHPDFSGEVTATYDNPNYVVIPDVTFDRLANGADTSSFNTADEGVFTHVSTTVPRAGYTTITYTNGNNVEIVIDYRNSDNGFNQAWLYRTIPGFSTVEHRYRAGTTADRINALLADLGNQ